MPFELKNKTRRGPSWPVRWPIVARAVARRGPSTTGEMAAACLAGLPTQRYRSSPYKRGLPEGSQHRATEGTDLVPIVLLAGPAATGGPYAVARRATDGPPTGHRGATDGPPQTTQKINFHFWKLIPWREKSKVSTYLAHVRSLGHGPLVPDPKGAVRAGNSP